MQAEADHCNERDPDLAKFEPPRHHGLVVAVGEFTAERYDKAVVARRLKFCEIGIDRKSTRLNSSHTVISYAVFCLKKKKTSKQSRTNISTRSSTRRSDVRTPAGAAERYWTSVYQPSDT